MAASGVKHGPLLERGDELQELERAFRAAPEGGRVVAITGPPGCGKTALLDVARRRAAEAGMDVYAAQANELERDFAFGGARQLFERAVTGLDSVERDRLLGGAAEFGWAAIGPGAEPPGGDPFTAMHGLYWLLDGLAADRPALLAVDDAQWLDAATLSWLEYVVHRIAELPVALVLTSRSQEPDEPQPLRRLLAGPSTLHLRPRPLSAEAVAQLLELRLAATPSAGFVAACRRATAGNAFVVRELVEALAAEGIAPTDAAVDRVGHRAPEAVARSLLMRLERLGPDATRFARALAVAGDGTPIAALAPIAGLSTEAAELAADALAAADLAQPRRPPSFVHALVRSAIVADLPAGELGDWHRRCAEALAELGGDPEAVAAHWLSVEPAGSAAVVVGLREAARRAIVRGDPDSATRYLRRALRERHDPATGLLHELGRAELLARDPACVERLLAALAQEQDGRRRAAVGVDAADALLFAGRWPESVRLAARLRTELADGDPLSFLLDTALAAALMSGSPTDRHFDLARLEARAAHPVPPARPLCLHLACLLGLRGAPAPEVLALVDRGYADGGFFEVASSDSVALAAAVMALIFVERCDRAGEVAEGMLADARRRGLVLGHVAGAAHRGLVAQRLGELADAEADLRDAYGLAVEHRLTFTLPFIAGYLSSVLLERGQIDEAAAVLGAVDAPGPDAGGTSLMTFYEARGAVRGAGGDVEGAVADLHAAGRAATAIEATNPAACAWSSRLALVLGEGDEARRLAAEELERARAAGLPRSIGVAERALALVGDPDRREEHLRGAVGQLVTTQAPLEHARACVDLGVALRQRGERQEAREHLLTGLDLAHRAGAWPLAERARSEAVALGARPRRPHLSGVEALTPAELRVARLASQGITNRQIAQALFVTRGTVKDHLGSTYRKLGITSRDGLPGLLG